MAFRFRKRISIVPGLRLNVGKRGVSVSAGVRGASATLGKSGLYGNIGATGTGLSYRARLDNKSGHKKQDVEKRRLDREHQRAQKESEKSERLANIKLRLQDNGMVIIEDAFGSPLSRSDTRMLWEQQGKTIFEWLMQEAEKMNGDVELLTNIYLNTPNPDSEPEYQVSQFKKPSPVKPEPPKGEQKPELYQLQPLGIFKRMLKKNIAEHEAENKKLLEKHEKALRKWEMRKNELAEQHEHRLEKWREDTRQWEEKKREHDAIEKERKDEFSIRIRNDVEVMNECLEEAISRLSWPRETLISYQIADNGEQVWLDVDLPEIEDLPQQVASMAASGRKLNIKNKSQKQLREEYATHVHGIAFRLAGAVFSTLPASQEAIISGYSQRLEKSTGIIKDDYLFSVRVGRERYKQIDFDALDKVDPVEAIGVFEIKRKMTATGIFKAIEPFSMT